MSCDTKYQGWAVFRCGESFAARPADRTTRHADLGRHVAANEFSGATAMGIWRLPRHWLKSLPNCSYLPCIRALSSTYAVRPGRSRAHPRKEICSWGGSCDVVRYDVQAPAAQQLAQPGAGLRDAPLLFRRRRRSSSRSPGCSVLRLVRAPAPISTLLGFRDLPAACSGIADGKLSVFCPSSRSRSRAIRGLYRLLRTTRRRMRHGENGGRGAWRCADPERAVAPTTHGSSRCCRIPRVLTDQDRQSARCRFRSAAAHST